VPDPPAKGGGSLIRTTMTRYESRWRVQPPTQVTSQSPKREPSVTGIRRRRNLVSSRIVLTVPVNTSITLGGTPSQVGFAVQLEIVGGFRRKEKSSSALLEDDSVGPLRSSSSNAHFGVLGSFFSSRARVCHFSGDVGIKKCYNA